MAASATFALKAGVWFRRGLLLIVSPDSLGTTVPAVRQKLHLSSCADFRDRLCLQIGLSAPTLKAIHDFRFVNRITSRPAAMRELLRRALAIANEDSRFARPERR